MTIQISIALPNDVFSALRSNPETFVQEMRLSFLCHFPGGRSLEAL
ncbi:MAG: hypothetical protein RMY34_21935 [Aulosira sp. DedQUE10]|nr:hypothetical protein [Aulosira sp. DedQUE10]